MLWFVSKNTFPLLLRLNDGIENFGLLLKYLTTEKTSSGTPIRLLYIEVS